MEERLAQGYFKLNIGSFFGGKVEEFSAAANFPAFGFQAFLF